MKLVQNLIYLILLLLPTYLIRFDILNIPFTLLELLILITFVIWIIKVRKLPELGWWKWALLLFIIAGLIGSIFSPDIIAAIGLWKAFLIEPVLVFLMILSVKPKFSKMVMALALCALFVSVVAIIQYISGYGIPAPWNIAGPEYRVTSVFDYPNAVGLLLAPIATLLLGYMYFAKEKKYKWLFLMAFVLSIGAMLFAQVDGAYLAILGAVVFFGLFTKWRWLILGAFIIAIIASLFIPQTRELILFQDTSGEVRLALWEGTINMLVAQPLQGSGLAGFADTYGEYKLDRHVEYLMYPHNIFLNFWTQLGILGLIWLLWVLIKIFYTGLKNQSWRNTIILGGFVCIIIYGLVDVPYFKNDLSVLFWSLLGIFTVLNNKYYKPLQKTKNTL